MRAMTQRRRALIAAAASSKINLVDVSGPLYTNADNFFDPSYPVDFSTKYVFFRYAASGYFSYVDTYTSSGDGFTFTCPSANYGAGFNFDVSPGDSYAIEATIDSISSGGGRVWVTWYGSDGKFISLALLAECSAGDTLSLTWTAPQNAAHAIVLFIVKNSNVTETVSNVGVYKE